MSIEAWWPRISEESREWLIANNGDAIPQAVVDEIARAGGVVSAEAWWAGESGPHGLYLSDAGVDWVETVANDEVPEPPSA